MRYRHSLELPEYQEVAKVKEKLENEHAHVKTKDAKALDAGMEKKPLFSQRTFAPEQKLTQAKIKINGRGIMHVEFITEKFAKLLPHILQELDQWNAQENSTPEAQNKQFASKMKCLKIRRHSSGKKNVYTKKYLKQHRSKKAQI